VWPELRLSEFRERTQSKTRRKRLLTNRSNLLRVAPTAVEDPVGGYCYKDCIEENLSSLNLPDYFPADRVFDRRRGIPYKIETSLVGQNIILDLICIH